MKTQAVLTHSFPSPAEGLRSASGQGCAGYPGRGERSREVAGSQPQPRGKSEVNFRQAVQLIIFFKTSLMKKGKIEDNNPLLRESRKTLRKFHILMKYQLHIGKDNTKRKVGMYDPERRDSWDKVCLESRSSRYRQMAGSCMEGRKYSSLRQGDRNCGWQQEGL